MSSFATRKVWRHLRSFFGTNQSGATAIEFALVAPVFFVFVFAIIETGLIYLAQSDLQFAANNAARSVRLGKAQSMDSGTFRTAICNNISLLLSCDASRLVVDVRTYTSFGGVVNPSPLKADGTLNSGSGMYQPGASGSIELVRVFYAWPVATPFLTPFLSNMGGNNHLLAATVAFRNEPF